MSERDAASDDFHEAVAADRASAAEEWDAMPVTTHPRDVVGEDGDILGDAVVEYLENANVGPIEFEGKEDYVRGDDTPSACCVGLDLVGAVPGQKGFVQSNRRTAQMSPVGFVKKSLPGGKSYLALATKKTSALDHDGAVAKARTVGKGAKVVAATLKNFKSAPSGKPAKRVVGDEFWIDLLGDEDPPAYDEIVGNDGYEIVGDASYEVSGEAAAAFEDVLGAKVVKKKKPSQISDAEVRALARDLEKSANKLLSKAESHAEKIEKQKAKDRAARVKAAKASLTTKASALAKLPSTTAKLPQPAGKVFTTALAKGKGVVPTKSFLTKVIGLIGQMLPGWTEETLPEGDATPYGGETYDPYATGDYVEPTLPPGPEENYGMGPEPTSVPPPPHVTDSYQVAAHDETLYSSDRGVPGSAPIPEGAVTYEGGRGAIQAASRTVYTGTAPGNKGDGFQGNLEPWGNWRMFEGTQYSKDVPPEYASSPQAMSEYSVSRGWGPLVGAPNVPDWRMLRVDAATGRGFWYYNTAPAWAKTPGDLDRLNKAILEYQAELTKAKTNYAAAVAQAKTAKEEADRRAREWALEQERIARETVAREHQTAMESEQLDMEYLKMQQQIDMQRQQLEMQQEQQYGQLEFQQAQAEQSAYQRWLESGGGEQPGEAYPYEEAGPFDDLYQQQPQGEGPWDDLSTEQVSDTLHTMDQMDQSHDWIDE